MLGKWWVGRMVVEVVSVGENARGEEELKGWWIVGA